MVSAALIVAVVAVYVGMSYFSLSEVMTHYFKPQLLQIEGWGVDKFHRGEVSDALARWGTRFSLQARLERQIVRSSQYALYIQRVCLIYPVSTQQFPAQGYSCLLLCRKRLELKAAKGSVSFSRHGTRS